MRIYSTFIHGSLELRGHMFCSGPQSIGGDGVPQEVADLFERLPRLKTISLSYKTEGDQEESAVVYQRMSEE